MKVILLKSKSEIQNTMDASLENDLLLLLLFRRCRNRRTRRRSLKRASPRFSVRNIFKKLKELGELHRFELQNEGLEHFSGKINRK